MTDTNAIVSTVGTAGTWVAVFLAALALIGIVTPWLILKQAYSTRNKALNAVHDKHQDFVTKGISIHRKIRFFRKPTEYSAPRNPGEHHSNSWRRHRPCAGPNRGHDSSATRPIIHPTGGTLDFHERRTQLPVSRYWILSIGLLGRYGYRADNGKAAKAITLKRSLNEERILVTSPGLCGLEPPEIPNNELEADSKSSVIESTGEEFISQTEKPETLYGVTGEISQFRRTSPAESLLHFTLHNRFEMGIDLPVSETLSLASLYWLANGFLPIFTAMQIGNIAHVVSLEDPPGDDNSFCLALKATRELQDSLDKLFQEWSDAQGKGPSQGYELFDKSVAFPTLNRDFQDHYSPIPPSRNNTSAVESARKDPDFQRSRACLRKKHLKAFLERLPFRTFELRLALDRPMSIKLATEAMQISNTAIFSFQESGLYSSESTPENEMYKYLKDCESGNITPSTAKWLLMPPNSYMNRYYVARHDVQNLVVAFLQMPWDSRGYLIGSQMESRYWNSLLERVVPLLLPAIGRCSTIRPELKAVVQREPFIMERIWKFNLPWEFNQDMTRILVLLETALLKTSPKKKVVYLIMALMAITNEPFLSRLKPVVETSESASGSVAITIALKDGVATWNDELFTYDLGALEREWDMEAKEVVVGEDDLLLATLWASLRCMLWKTSLSADPLVDFVKSLSQAVHVG